MPPLLLQPATSHVAATRPASQRFAIVSPTGTGPSGQSDRLDRNPLRTFAQGVTNRLGRTLRAMHVHDQQAHELMELVFAFTKERMEMDPQPLAE